MLDAQAREMMLLPEDTDLVAFWQKVLEYNPDNADVLERLGKTCLYEDKDEKGIEYIKQAIRLNPGENILHLDIARYYMYQYGGLGRAHQVFGPDLTALLEELNRTLAA